ncbi:LysR substrate-binding domain-containing protein [Vulgatibacter sp.]|uniref:LysR substrate-binding domain-containing protein n=1 Tax=Vulgatibacter sp. TaxID=1971226 RepID=UPI00356A0F43
MRISTHLHDAMTFDLELLRAFLAVVDCGSFTAAGVRLHRTQSTVSQQIRRLEEMTGRHLLDRTTRNVVPTEDGERLLGYARRILELNDEARQALAAPPSEHVARIGVPDDFSADRLTQTLATFANAHQRLRLEVTSALSRELRRLYDEGELDLALIKQHKGPSPARHTWAERLCWVDSRKHPTFGRDPVPLVVFPRSALYREEVIASMEALGRRSRISYVSQSLASLQAAVADGLGVSLLPARAVLDRHRVLGPETGLPSIETIEIALYHPPEADAVILQLAEQLSLIVEAATELELASTGA